MANIKVPGPGAPESWTVIKASGAGTNVDPAIIETSGGGGGGGGDASAANQTTQLTYTGALTETAPATDTGSSGLNGRLQRMAQRITSLIALVPASLGQKAMTASLAVTLASDQASEGHLGEVGNAAAVVTPTVTVSTSPAYTAGDSIGGKITLTSAVRVSGGVSMLVSLMILDRANQKPTGTILIYNADPTNATLTDNSAVVNSTDDLKVVASIPIVAGDYVTINSKAYANLSALAREVKAASGTTLYASFTVTSTPTFAATTDVQLIFGFVPIN